MYYGWNSTKVLHEERVKQLSQDSQRQQGKWLAKLRLHITTMVSWIRNIVRRRKAKRHPYISACTRVQQSQTNHNPCT